MTQPHRCPVCGGNGLGYSDPKITAAAPRPCHACGGCGYVWSPEKVIIKERAPLILEDPEKDSLYAENKELREILNKSFYENHGTVQYYECLTGAARSELDSKILKYLEATQ